MSPNAIRSPASPAGGRRWSGPASRSTPTAISSSAPTCSAAAWASPARPRPIRRPACRGASIFPVITIARHGARAGDAARSSRHRLAVLRSPAARWAACRCCNGRRAIRERVFAALPIAAAARHSAQNIAFHEVGRQAVMADPDWRGGRYFAERHQSAARARGRAHGRAHHLSVRRGAAPQVRPQLPGPRQSDLLVRRRFPGRDAICATRASPSSSASTPIPISISPARWTISISPPITTASLANAFRGTPTRFCVISFTSDWLFPTAEIARHRACAQRRRRAGVASPRSTTDKGHDAFLLDEPEFHASCAASSRRRARRAACRSAR